MGRTRPRERSGERETPIDSEDGLAQILGALDDSDCREILKMTGDEALSASELAELCDLPLSTTYRKLELLTEAGLLEERTRIRHSGKHVSEYVVRIDDVMISIDSGNGIEVEISSSDSQTQSASF